MIGIVAMKGRVDMKTWEKCPHCGEELKSGKLFTYHQSYFLEEGCKGPKWLTRGSIEKSGAIWLPPTPYPTEHPELRDHPDALACQNCHVIIIPYEKYDHIRD